MLQPRIRVLTPAAIAVWLAACATPAAPRSGSNETACIPGTTLQCFCPDGAVGAQICDEDGAGYGACTCEPPATPDTMIGDTTEDPGAPDITDDPGPDDAPEDPGPGDVPEAPGDVPEDPGSDDVPEDPGSEDVPEDPGPEDVPEDPEDVSEDPEDVPEDSGPGDVPEDPDPEDPPEVEDDCLEIAKLVYLISNSHELIRFNPETLQQELVGIVSCPAGGATPFSMSVQRTGVAWVLYSDGSLWKVSITDASCAPTTFSPGGFELFGMGFASDGPGTLDETLYIAGEDGLFGPMTLGSIELLGPSASPIAALPNSALPELTGSRDGDLYGFLPQQSPPTVARIDKSDASFIQTITLDAATFSNVQAWAFALWAGQLYLFYQGVFDPGAEVWQLDPGTGQTTLLVENFGATIVGAGVSTCAPGAL